MAKPNKRDLKNEKRATDPKVQEAKRIQKLTTYTGAAVVGALLIGVLSYSILNRPAPIDFNLDSQPVLGDPTAAVKIVEFGDFKCPACKQFHDSSFLQLKEEYIDTGKAAFYFINFDIPNVTGFDSTNASLASECFYRESNDLFWSYYDKIYANQPEEREAWAMPDSLMQLIKDLNVDPELNEEETKNCIVNKTYENELIADRAIGNNAGVRGTPSIFVNGKLTSTVYGALKQVIEAELAKQQ